MDINFQTKFNIGDLVFLKTIVDQYSDTSEEIKDFIEYYLPFLLFKIKEIKIQVILDENTQQPIINEYYTLDFYYSEAKLSQIKQPYASIITELDLSLISKDNLYSFEEGKQKIISKIEDFKSYLNNL